VLGTQTLSDEIERAIRKGAPTKELDAAYTLVEAKLAVWEKNAGRRELPLAGHGGRRSSTLRDIEDLLSVPLVSGDDRNRLREKYLRIARALVTATGGGSSQVAETAAAGPTGAGTQPLEPLLPSREHLALTILTRFPGV